VHDIADALRYLHGRAPPVVHRDIKPGNIIRRHDGSYALVDFGAVADRLKPEGGSTVVGTYGYMAPEQFQGRASARSDLYGLGATALVMLTGREPEDLPHVGLGIDVAKAVPSGTPAPLVRALASMLNPDPDRRASSIDEALALLDGEAGATHREVPREPEPPSDARARREQRKTDARREKRRRRDLARSRRAPLVPRLLGQIALLAALLVVWVTVGLALPLVLMILSLVFGGSLRRAAAATRRAASRSQSTLRRGSAWLSGQRDEDVTPSARVRVDAASDRVRVHEDDENATAEHDGSDETEPLDPSAEVRRRSARRP